MLNQKERKEAIDILGHVISYPEDYIAEKNQTVMENGERYGEKLLEDLHELIQKNQIGRENAFDFVEVVNDTLDEQKEIVPGFLQEKKEAFRKLKENREEIAKLKHSIKNEEAKRDALLELKNKLDQTDPTYRRIKDTINQEILEIENHLTEERKSLEQQTAEFHKSWSAMWGARTEEEQKIALDKEAFFEETGRYFKDRWQNLKEKSIAFTHTVADVVRNTQEVIMRPYRRNELQGSERVAFTELQGKRLLQNFNIKKMSIDLKNYNEAKQHLQEMEQKIRIKALRRSQEINGIDYIKVGLKRMVGKDGTLPEKGMERYTVHEQKVLRKAAEAVELEKRNLVKEIERYNRKQKELQMSSKKIEEKFKEHAEKYKMNPLTVQKVVERHEAYQARQGLTEDLRAWYQEHQLNPVKIEIQKAEEKQEERGKEEKGQEKNNRTSGQRQDEKKLSIEEKQAIIKEFFEEMSNPNITLKNCSHSMKTVLQCMDDVRTELASRDRGGKEQVQTQEKSASLEMEPIITDKPLSEIMPEDVSHYSDEEIEYALAAQQEMEEIEQENAAGFELLNQERTNDELTAFNPCKYLDYDEKIPGDNIDIPIVRGGYGQDYSRSLERFLTDEHVEFGISATDVDAPVRCVDEKSIEGVKNAFEKFSEINFGDPGFVTYDYEHESLCMKHSDKEGNLEYCLIPVEECRKAGVAMSVEEQLDHMLEERCQDPEHFVEKYVDTSAKSMRVISSDIRITETKRGQDLIEYANSYGKQGVEKEETREEIEESNEEILPE